MQPNTVNPFPQQVSPQQVAPQQVAPLQVAPQQVAPQQVAPQQVAPQQVAPQQVTPQQVAPQQVAPQQIASVQPLPFNPQGVSMQPRPVVLPSQRDVRKGRKKGITKDEWEGGCVAQVGKTRGLIIMLLCFFFGGFGTCISACLDDSGCDCGIFCLGFLQLLLTPLLIGYIWSFITGIMTFVKAYGTLCFIV